MKERRNRGGSISFVLECGSIKLPGGRRKRIRHYFKTREEAEKEGRELRAVRREHGQKAALARVTALTGLDDCLPIFQARGLTIKDAVQLAVQPKPNATTLPVAVSPTPLDLAPAAEVPSASSDRASNEITVGQAIEELIAERVEAKKGEAPSEHEKIMRQVLRKAFRKHLDQPIREIGVPEVREALKATRTRLTRGKWLSAMNQLFSYASAEGIDYLSFNPAGAILRPPRYGPNRSGDMNEEKEEVEILNPEQITRLLHFVEQAPKYRCMVIPLCMQAFFGLRRVEVARFSALEFQKNDGFDQYSVVPKRTRSRQNRWVTKNKTFARWLERWWKPGDPIYPKSYPQLLRQIIHKLELKWTRSILRHTFASHYFRIHGEKETVREMGHALSDTTFKHYLRKVTMQDALKFWKIRPESSTVTLPSQTPVPGSERGYGETLAELLEKVARENGASEAA